MSHPRHTAVAGMLTDGDRILLCHRRPDRSYYPGVWDLPGGHIAPGEEPEDALVRELREELDIEIGRPDQPPMATLLQDEGDLEVMIWAIDEWTGELRNSASDEHDALRWMDKHSIEPLRLAVPGMIELLNPHPPSMVAWGESTVRAAFDMAAQYAWRFEEGLTHLPDDLALGIVRAYVCLRAVDEIEDHPMIEPDHKVTLLRSVSDRLRAGHPPLTALFDDVADMAAVSRRLEEWIALPPRAIAPRIDDAVAAMADRMAYWVERGWSMRSQVDLDRYCFDVSCSGYLLFDDLFAWHSGEPRDRRLAVACGRQMYLSHLVRHREDDLLRGVDLYPTGWDDDDAVAYARQFAGSMEAYARQPAPPPIMRFLESFLLDRYHL